MDQNRPPAYGVCDSPDQFASRFPTHRGLVGFLCVDRESEPPSLSSILKLVQSGAWPTKLHALGQGWRWHKWGPYVGVHNLHGLEYLSDADGQEGRIQIDEQWVFNAEEPAHLCRFLGFHHLPILCAVDHGRLWTIPLSDRFDTMENQMFLLTLSVAKVLAKREVLLGRLALLTLPAKPAKPERPLIDRSLVNFAGEYVCEVWRDRFANLVAREMEDWQRPWRFDQDPILGLLPEADSEKESIQFFHALVWHLRPNEVPFRDKIWRVLGPSPPCVVCCRRDTDETVHQNIVWSFYKLCTDEERQWLVTWNKQRIWNSCLLDLSCALDLLALPGPLLKLVCGYASLFDWPDWICQ